MRLAVKRKNTDFGNSFMQSLINGYYIEFPTNVVELTEEEAAEHEIKAESGKDFLERMLIATTYGGMKRYYLVGKSAQDHVLGNQHTKLHNKLQSHIPYMTFLAGMCYYYGLKLDEEIEKGKEDNLFDEHVIDVDYFSTMLPIWLLKQRNKFSEMQNEFAERFFGEHKVEIATLGLEKEITINVKQSKCRIESEIARWAIRKNIDLTDKEEARSFDQFKALMCDIGGGTSDIALLGKGLKAPASRNDLQCITDIPFLDHLDKLRNEKLLDYFPTDLRLLEEFIYKNIDKPKMELKYGNTGKVIDLTKPIHDSLRQYAKLLLSKIESVFPARADEVYKYVWFGGVVCVLKAFIQEEVTSRYGEAIMQENHFFADNPRKLNLLALEILSINDTKNAA